MPLASASVDTFGIQGNSVMRLSRFILLVTFTALLLSPLLTFAKEKDKHIIKAVQREQFTDLVTMIRKEMEDGGRFEFVTPAERAEVNQHLDTIAEKLAKGDLESLHHDEKIDVLAAQENANAILTRRDGNRMICERRSPTGSHFKVKKCMTYAEHVRAREEAQKDFSDNMRRPPADFCMDPKVC